MGIFNFVLMFYTTGQSSTLHSSIIERLVETLELYMIGWCANNDEQLGYIETCVACLKWNQFE